MNSRRTRPHVTEEVPEAIEPEAEAATSTEEAAAPDLAAELEAVRNRELRLAADFENFRKRALRERQEATVEATARLFERLVPSLDDLLRALEHAPGDVSETWLRGVQLAVAKLEEVFSEAGVKPIEAVGTKFDPRLHEAIGSVESDQPEDTVLAELRRGYVLGDRVLRPSLVRVAAGASTAPAQA